MNFNRISKLSELLTNDLKRKPTILLEPNKEQAYRMYGLANDVVVGIDADEWEIPNELEQFVEDIAKSKISTEEKMLEIYQKVCESYTYDDNVLSYIKKNDDESFFLPDAYGRSSDSSWKENREKHNRRNCFEVSRILAKSISEMIKLSEHSKNYDVCIIWDETNTHYFVGVASNDYYVSLDLDDFAQIKDLTRMKTGLTLEGVNILEDPLNKFGAEIEKINKDRSKIAKEHIKEKSKDDSIESDDIVFLQYTVQILKQDYNLDPSGVYEYLKEIVDTKMGARFRKKVWKEVDNGPGKGARYTRCLIVNTNDDSYIIDVTENDPSKIIQPFDERELEDESSNIIPYKEMSRDWNTDPYDGR